MGRPHRLSFGSHVSATVMVPNPAMANIPFQYYYDIRTQAL
jgi:hypothetical protein